MQIYTNTLLAALATTALATTTATVGNETFVFKWGKLISGVPAALPTTHLSRPLGPHHVVVTEVLTTTKAAVVTKTVQVQARGVKEFWHSFVQDESDSFKHLGEEIKQDLHHRRDVAQDDQDDEDEDPIYGDFSS